MVFYEGGWKGVKLAFPNLKRATLYRWKKEYEDSGRRLNSLLPQSTIPKRKRVMIIPLPILALIRQLRERYPRMGFDKITYYLYPGNMQKGLATVFLVVGCLLLIILAGGVYYFTNQVIPSAKPRTAVLPTPKPATTASWKTYKNPLYLFTIQFPINWKIEPLNSEGDSYTSIDLNTGNYKKINNPSIEIKVWQSYDTLDTATSL